MSSPRSSLSLTESPLVYETQAPTGIFARGHYTAKTKFTDDDNLEHLMFQWSFDITKEW